MAYNYDKDWLVRQDETIKLLLKLADQQGEAVYSFDNPNERANYSSYLCNVKASLALHYPTYANVHRVLRTWTDIDHTTGSFILHVGTLNNYHAGARQTKGRKGQTKMVDLKLRGATPTGATMSTPSALSVLQPYGITVPTPVAETVDPDAETFECEDTQDADLVKLTPIIRTNADGLKAQLIRFTNCSLEPTTIATFMTGMPEWTIEDADPTTGETVVKLLLRRKDQTNG